MNRKKTLIYGYGNPGRQDDALANELINRIEGLQSEGRFAGVDTDSNYQLNIEDAEIISHYERVVFVDASTEDIEDALLSEVQPSGSKIEFTMHAVSPSFVLDLCMKMYKRRPRVYLLHIKGYEWEFMQEMSRGARQNLEKALALLEDFLKQESAAD